MRTLAQNHRVICAAPAYLAGRSLPEKPTDLVKHDCIVLRENDEDATLWRFTKEGESTSVRVEPKLSSNDGSVIMQWALAGRGIVIRSEWDAADDIKAKRLIPLLSGYTLPRADIVLLIGNAAEAGGRTRSFIDFLSIKLEATSWARISSL
jgi:DNA-binding transcriptional LysR family regulator